MTFALVFAGFADADSAAGVFDFVAFVEPASDSAGLFLLQAPLSASL